MTLKQLPLLNYVRLSEESEFGVMLKYLRILNPQLAAVCQKQIAQNGALQRYVETFNRAIHFINFNQIDELKALYQQTQSLFRKSQAEFECSVCQLPIAKGLTLFCMQCNHGGHYEHVLSWFAKNKYCPQCFKCHCLEK